MAEKCWFRSVVSKTGGASGGCFEAEIVNTMARHFKVRKLPWFRDRESTFCDSTLVHACPGQLLCTGHYCLEVKTNNRRCTTKMRGRQGDWIGCHMIFLRKAVLTVTLYSALGWIIVRMEGYISECNPIEEQQNRLETPSNKIPYCLFDRASFR